MKILLLALLAALTGFPQTPPAAVQPAYVVLAGGEYDRTAGTAAGLVSFGARVADRTYSYSTIELKAARQSSLRTGVARIMSQKNGWTLLALGDAGLTTDTGVALGAFSAGAVALYDISNLTHVDGLHAFGGLRVLKVSSQSVEPVFEFGLAKEF
jgi:hypothetical protein